ncbi:unnamed protein product [Caenorhabditis angaria]|uniref:Galectin n=1 Tax=Caenorhabditis angaria TaxID=860376 RepID=A0A9P1ILZ1_9PELO|nr:unnamed protein product [Caenorhabditis angaria]
MIGTFVILAILQATVALDCGKTEITNPEFIQFHAFSQEISTGEVYLEGKIGAISQHVDFYVYRGLPSTASQGENLTFWTRFNPFGPSTEFYLINSQRQQVDQGKLDGVRLNANSDNNIKIQFLPEEFKVFTNGQLLQTIPRKFDKDGKIQGLVIGGDFKTSSIDLNCNGLTKNGESS